MNYLFTTFRGAPASQARIFSAVLAMMRRRLSMEAQLMWGVMMQFFACRRGLSPEIGSEDPTSSPAA